MAVSPGIYETTRITLAGAPLDATKVNVPSAASALTIRPEAVNARISFTGTDGAPLGPDYFEFTFSTVNTIPVGTAAVYVAANAAAPVVQLFFS